MTIICVMAADQGSGIIEYTTASSIESSINGEILPIYLTPDIAPQDKYQTNFDVQRKDWMSPRQSSKIQLAPDFFVPPHPISIVIVPYGLFMVFAAWLSPDLIPQTWPLGALAYYLGINYNGLVAFLSIGAGILHLIEPIWALYIAGTYGLNLTTSVLWAFSGLVFGIFGLWPLVFPEFFFSVKDQYCQYSPKSTALYSPCSLKFSSQKYKKTT